ncbi:rCG22935 [Rattus norvegicus]|uniref:RCG22935 n=1 Tax=Rattus norvegicus TaxID=10116 RepID=A6KB32_RAT|nr:rCG22935 [Rattus norvegicus]
MALLPLKIFLQNTVQPCCC